MSNLDERIKRAKGSIKSWLRDARELFAIIDELIAARDAHRDVCSESLMIDAINARDEMRRERDEARIWSSALETLKNCGLNPADVLREAEKTTNEHEKDREALRCIHEKLKLLANHPVVAACRDIASERLKVHEVAEE